MEKTNKNGSIIFHPTVKTYLPPVIVDEFFDDNDVRQFILANGNTIPADRYNGLWNPNKTAVNWKAKDANPDRSRIAH